MYDFKLVDYTNVFLSNSQIILIMLVIFLLTLLLLRFSIVYHFLQKKKYFILIILAFIGLLIFIMHTFNNQKTNLVYQGQFKVENISNIDQEGNQNITLSFNNQKQQFKDFKINGSIKKGDIVKATVKYNEESLTPEKVKFGNNLNLNDNNKLKIQKVKEW